MCGIFALLNNENEIPFKNNFINDQFTKGKNRGPEFSKLIPYNIKCMIGFHRLAINGLNNQSNQPIIIGDIALICNGEIYNYKELFKLMNITPITQSDCEIIIHLYKQHGMKQTLQMLDGVFSFILCDSNIYNKYSKIYVARDPYGVRPLYILKTTDIHNEQKNTIYGIASEIKVLTNFHNELPNHIIEHFKPGTYSKYISAFKVSSQWNIKKEYINYHTPGFTSILVTKYYDYNNINEITYYLYEAVKKRLINTERPIACLLSGGLDSSLITSIVCDLSNKPVETYSIGIEGSDDLKNARIVADYLGTIHTEIIMTEKEIISIIPEIIYAIESYDTTTIRASIGNYLLGKYISNNSEAKVIFNGDGSDELCGGYLYMNASPNAIEFDKECRRLLKNIHVFDVLRSDKCISSHGLEPRTPFLDRTFVQYYLSIHPSIRYHPGNNQCEKYLLRNSFSGDNFRGLKGKPLLPESILWRTKEAFSDGISKMNRPIYEIIQEYILNNKVLSSDNIIYTNNIPDTVEKQYYREIFDKYYPRLDNIIPYFWMPKYTNATDASARTLSFYKNNNNNII